MRLDKFLSILKIGTRSEIKKIIKSKKIKVNDQIITEPDYLINERTDQVKYNDEILKYEENIYIMFNKPSGYLSANYDNYQETIMKFFPEKYHDLTIIGRLDKDTEGLLLLTNDGKFAHEITSPKKHIEKEYYVEYSGTLPDNIIEIFNNGVIIENDYLTKPAQIKNITENSAYLTIHEGKFHQVKQMFKAVGTTVTYLKRVRIGKLLLDPNLKLGEYKKISKEEIK